MIFLISYIQSYFPPERSKKILGRFHGIEAVLGSDNPFGVILATLVGVPMYADIFGTILSFMMAVTTLSLPSMIMLRKAVKPKLLVL